MQQELYRLYGVFPSDS